MKKLKPFTAHKHTYLLRSFGLLGALNFAMLLVTLFGKVSAPAHVGVADTPTRPLTLRVAMYNVLSQYWDGKVKYKKWSRAKGV